MEIWQYKVLDLTENRLISDSFEVLAQDIDFDVEEVVLTSPIAVSASLVRIERSVSVDLVVEAELALECRRCLTPFRQRVRGLFSARYEPTHNPERLLDPFLEVGLRYYMGEYLDLARDIRETLVLELPHWPLCSEECKGLCPVCGHNLNEGPCNCEEALLHPSKFSVLASLLQK